MFRIITLFTFLDINTHVKKYLLFKNNTNFTGKYNSIVFRFKSAKFLGYCFYMEPSMDF